MPFAIWSRQCLYKHLQLDSRKMNSLNLVLWLYSPLFCFQHALVKKMEQKEVFLTQNAFHTPQNGLQAGFEWITTVWCSQVSKIHKKYSLTSFNTLDVLKGETAWGWPMGLFRVVDLLLGRPINAKIHNS